MIHLQLKLYASLFGFLPKKQPSADLKLHLRSCLDTIPCRLVWFCPQCCCVAKDLRMAPSGRRFQTKDPPDLMLSQLNKTWHPLQVQVTQRFVEIWLAVLNTWQSQENQCGAWSRRPTNGIYIMLQYAKFTVENINYNSNTKTALRIHKPWKFYGV